ncbi:unnamed protein product [Taenia asiatica]|uniref:UBIQUITIN_CONJUGAT_2 domain-containing protein n=1 Tax=Taenia asiatica TaxID=60517 RepID=A0A0R3WBJ0_TAEAS|nr:unnamed protein product [Taenia asiatica]
MRTALHPDDASTDGQASIVGIDEMTIKISLRLKPGYNAIAEFLLTVKSLTLYPLLVFVFALSIRKDSVNNNSCTIFYVCNACCPAYPSTCPNVTFDSLIFHFNIGPSSGFLYLRIPSEWQRRLSLSLSSIFELPIHLFGVPQDPAQLAKKTVRLLASLWVTSLRFPLNPALNRESTKEACYASSENTSDTVLSVAKSCYFFEAEDEDISWHPYKSRYTPFEVDSQRVPIWPPSGDRKQTTLKSSNLLSFWEPIIIEVILVNSTTLSSLALSCANISRNLLRDKLPAAVRGAVATVTSAQSDATSCVTETLLDALSPFYHMLFPLRNSRGTLKTKSMKAETVPTHTYPPALPHDLGGMAVTGE